MDIVLKVSTDYTRENTKAQFINPSGLSFVQELVNTGSLTFRIPLSDPQINEIIEYRKVALYIIDGGEDQLLWTGYIEDPDNDFSYAIIKCSDEKDFLRSKMIFGDKDWELVTVNVALNILVTEANLRKGVNEPSLSFSTDLGDVVIGKKFTMGTSYFDILTAITQVVDGQLKVEMNQIILKAMIGTDRTTIGDDYLEFIWNNESPNENNITKFFNRRKGAEIATRVIGKPKTGSVADITGDTSIFGSIERSVAMEDGNATLQTQEFVNKHEVSQIERGCEVDISVEKFRMVNVGDLVKIKIAHNSVLANTNTSLKVIQKTAKFENKRPITSIKLSSETKQVASMNNFLSELSRRVKRLELY